MSGKAKLCVYCGKSREQHFRDRKRRTRKERMRGDGTFKPQENRHCAGGAHTFTLVKPEYDVRKAKVNNNPVRSFLRAWPLEMVDGNWTRKNLCPVCARVLPPFFATAGLKAKQGHVTEVDCTNCHSKIGKPEGWSVGEPLDVLFNAPEAMQKVLTPKNEGKVMEK